MPIYSVHLSTPADKTLNHADRQHAARLREALKALAQDPSQGKRLVGPLAGKRTWRVGKWRIVYRLEGRRIEVERIEWRDKAYR